MFFLRNTTNFLQDRRNDMFVSKKIGIGIGQNFGLFAQCIDIQIVKKIVQKCFP